MFTGSPSIESTASEYPPSSIPSVMDKAGSPMLINSVLTIHLINSTKSPAYGPKDLQDPETDKPIFLQPHAFNMMFELHTLIRII